MPPSALAGDPWSDLFPLPAKGSENHDAYEEMLRLIAYDIADPKRLRLVAEACADYGVRVQKSLFECWLEQDRFDQLWQRLEALLNKEEDCIAAYVLDRGAARQRRCLGREMVFSQPRMRYVL